MSGTGRPDEAGVVAARPGLGGGRATPSFGLPPGAGSGLPGLPAPSQIGARLFRWGERTFVMGVLNVTPDSFSGDGLLGAGGDPVGAAVALGRRMVDEGADFLDVGGESTRPGHSAVDADEERGRVVPVIAALHEVLPEVPISVDTTKEEVAEAALGAGAALLNDVGRAAPGGGLARVAADRGVPIIVMHNRAEARYINLVAEVVADLQRAVERTLDAGVPWDSIIIDPGVGFGKTAEHNLVLLRELGALRLIGRPILVGTSRKSTLGRVLDLPPDERIEATVATTALGIAAGIDIVRVHDVRANVRAARVADAIIRATWPLPGAAEGAPP